MKICLISVEIFAWGKHGGFGRATRLIGRELARRGHSVSAVVPRRPGQQTVEKLDGITVFGFDSWRPWQASELLKQADADIFHSCEPSFSTYLAMRAMPHRRHVVTFRDPRTVEDWRMEFNLPSLNRLQVLHNFWYENNWLIHRAVRRMDAIYTSGRCLIPKVRAMYHLAQDPEFLPTPVLVPKLAAKAASPTVCYVARLDRRKRPELFLNLVRAFPDVRFIAMGKSRDANYERYLRETYGALPNLELMGFVDQFSDLRHADVLSRSWIMVNTATREGLPNAFLEAASSQCAILSAVDPDGFASQFGYHVQDGDFAKGLASLLAQDRWRQCGKRAADTMRSTFDLNRAIDLHERAYEQALNCSAAGRYGFVQEAKSMMGVCHVG